VWDVGTNDGVDAFPFLALFSKHVSGWHDTTIDPRTMIDIEMKEDTISSIPVLKEWMQKKGLTPKHANPQWHVLEYTSYY
jgi:hypothetical protein